MAISDKARDLIVEQEVSSKAIYVKKYQRPEWPGGGSGVTVAIGYDLGMASRDKIERDWKDLVTPEMLNVMKGCAGISGAAARTKCAGVRSMISIPWDDAIKVFDRIDMPAWEQTVIKAIPKAADLNPDCLGVLVSIAYNRGASFSKQGSRYAEMRDIRSHVQNNRLAAVPASIRSMKRLWDKNKLPGLHVRREAEAKLWEVGMTKPQGQPGAARAAKEDT